MSNSIPAVARTRCAWLNDDPLYVAYHDEEWGVPQHDSRALFECLLLEGAQAGLSWYTILRKREGYRRAFAGFDPVRMARFDRRRLDKLVADPAIVRHRGKIEAFVANARAWLAMRDAGEDPAAFLWDFVDGAPIVNRWRSHAQIPAKTPVSERMSRELKRRGFRFVGATTCYAFMQATGMVNDHIIDCYRFYEV